MRKTHLSRPMALVAVTLSMFLCSPAMPATFPSSIAYADEATDAKERWERLQSEAEERYDALTNASGRIAELEEAIGQNEARIADLSAQLDDAKADLGRLLADDYKNPSRPSMDAILGASDLAQLMERMEYSSRFMSAEQDMVESVSCLMGALRDAQGALTAEKQALEEQRAQLEGAAADAEAKADEAKSYYAGLSAETRRDITETDIESRMRAREEADAAGLPDSVTAADALVESAYSIIGSGYSWSGYIWTGDVGSSAFTCSGVVDYALGRETNSSSPESLYAEVGSNMVYDASQLRYGDIVFWAYDGRYPTGHTGIYVGNGQVIDSIPNGGVQIRDVNYMEFVGGGPIL